MMTNINTVKSKLSHAVLFLHLEILPHMSSVLFSLPSPPNSMMFPSLSILLPLSLLLFTAISSPTPSTSVSVYEILTKFGLPSGLLPDSVSSYSLDQETGKFTVELPKPCYIHFDYLVYYDKKITGTLKIGSITDLHGIQVKKLFLWLDVDEIRVDLPPSDSIYFQVGFINKKLDVDQFESVHACKDNGLRCGFSSLLKLPTPTRESPTLVTE